MNDATELPASAQVPQPEGETEVPASGLPEGGLPESEHSAAEHAFPTDHPLEKWIREAHG
ncbi:MAG TPA: hypothetical protein VGD78_00585 [Chthoniobacterales bacterium]